MSETRDEDACAQVGKWEHAPAVAEAMSETRDENACAQAGKGEGGDADKAERARRKTSYNALIREAKALGAKGAPAADLCRAVRLYREAALLFPGEKIAGKIAKLEGRIPRAVLHDPERQVEAGEFERCGADGPFYRSACGSRYHLCATEASAEGGASPVDFFLPADAFERLYEYQRECLAWLWSVHGTGSGAVLGDDMGLGKTVQVSSYLRGLFASGAAATALVVAPLSVLDTWVRELAVWCPGAEVHKVHGVSKAKRERMLQRLQERGGVGVTTPGMVRDNCAMLRGRPLPDDGDAHDHDLDEEDDAKCPRMWDVFVVDEGHSLKNHNTAFARRARRVPAGTRLVLTGTPVMNRLTELWALFDFACRGRLLGDHRAFKELFSNRIEAGAKTDANDFVRQRAARTAEDLREMIAPHFLRREKAEIAAAAAAAATQAAAIPAEDGAAPSEAAPVSSLASSGVVKHDMVVWLPPSEDQLRLYRAFLETDEVAEVLNTTRNALSAMSVLKTICTHPRLLSDHAASARALPMRSGPECYSPASLARESSKMGVLLRLLRSHVADGHRTLVFSMSRKMLDLVEVCLLEEGMRSLRIDGGVPQPARTASMDLFNSGREDIPVFLLTTTAGGLGISLTAASRVVIVDPAWNPAVDAQAVDRAFRIGQRQNVLVYRLITSGTIEEVIYRKQCFKNTLFRSATEAGAQQSSFSANELREVFSLGDTQQSATREQLEEQFPDAMREVDEGTRAHLDRVVADMGAGGITNHGHVRTAAAVQVDVSADVDGEVAAARATLLKSATPARRRGGGKKQARRRRGEVPAAEEELAAAVVEEEESHETEAPPSLSIVQVRKYNGLVGRARDESLGDEKRLELLLAALDIHAGDAALCDSVMALSSSMGLWP